MDSRTLGYLGLGALTGIALAAVISQRERMAFAWGGGSKDLSDYRKQSGEGSETTPSEMERRDEEMFRAEVQD